MSIGLASALCALATHAHPWYGMGDPCWLLLRGGLGYAAAPIATPTAAVAADIDMDRCARNTLLLPLNLAPRRSTTFVESTPLVSPRSVRIRTEYDGTLMLGDLFIAARPVQGLYGFSNLGSRLNLYIRPRLPMLLARVCLAHPVWNTYSLPRVTALSLGVELPSHLAFEA